MLGTYILGLELSCALWLATILRFFAKYSLDLGLLGRSGFCFFCIGRYLERRKRYTSALLWDVLTFLTLLFLLLLFAYLSVLVFLFHVYGLEMGNYDCSLLFLPPVPWQMGLVCEKIPVGCGVD